MIRTIRQAIATAIRGQFAPYMVWDSHGTQKLCWTMEEAMAWLPYCSADVGIVNRQTRIIEVSRHQKRAY